MRLKSAFQIPRAAQQVLLGAVTLGAAIGSTACLDRPIGVEQPRTTNVIVDTLVQSAVDKIDLLFMIDNSISMADKQEILAAALPDLVGRLVSPVCVTPDNTVVEHPNSANDRCPAGSAREFNPIDDIHIGVITSSLGGYGAEFNCKADPAVQSSEQTEDMAVLLGALPRGAAAAPSAATSGFLSWTSNGDRAGFSNDFSELVKTAGEFGCGWEASLEAWYRFLIDPIPYTKIVRQNCGPNDTAMACAGPEGTAQGQLINEQILAQRKAFLRPDSLLAIVMLTDENDCSFKASGQTWRLSQTLYTLNNGVANYTAYKGTAACADPAYGPNHECCHSCGQTSVPGGCPTAVDDEGATVGLGCEAGRKFPSGDKLDHPNLRCFQQKVRFGVDYLYPVERYSRALKDQMICPFAFSETLAEEDCIAQGQPAAPNPIFQDLQFDDRKAQDPNAVKALPRSPGLVFLAGIVGVPWQDVAVSPDPNDTLKYRVARPDAMDDERINWDWIVGDRSLPVPQPLDPLMVESVAPRSGSNPATGEALAGIGAGYMANSINGHEWDISDGSDLQYACIFPKASETCQDLAVAQEQREMGLAVPNCDCTDYPGDTWKNPLCQAENGSYGNTQTYAKAYPSLRELQVLQDFGANSIVASICPKEATNDNAADYGYRPAVAAIVDRLKEQLADKCLTRSLSVKENADGEPETACYIIEARRVAGGQGGCDAGSAREPVSAVIEPVARRELRDGKQCNSDADCAGFQLCQITQLTPARNAGDYNSCLNDNQATGDGWCYVDPAKGLGAEELVEKCPDTSKRKLRFVGAGTPESGTVTLVACSGEAYDDE